MSVITQVFVTKSYPFVSSIKPLKSSSKPFPAISFEFVKIFCLRSLCQSWIPVSTTHTFILSLFEKVYWYLFAPILEIHQGTVVSH
jgi:hypothetical protein